MADAATVDVKIKKGDTLEALVKKHKYKDGAKKLWEDPCNKALRQKRKDPKNLQPGDVVKIPQPAPKAAAADTAQDTGAAGDVKSALAKAKTKEISFAFCVSTTGRKPDVVKLHATKSGKQLYGEIKKETGLSAGAYGFCSMDGNVLKLRPYRKFNEGAKRLKKHLKGLGISIQDVVLDDALEGTDEIYEFQLKGKTVRMNKPEFEKFKKDLVATVKRGVLFEVRQKAVGARTCWDHFSKLNNGRWQDQAVNWLIEASSGAKMPSESLIKTAEKAHSRLDGYVQMGNLKGIAETIPLAEKAVNKALDAMHDYRDKLIGSGENWVTGLEITKTACFTVVTAVATGGMGVGAAAATSAGLAALESASTEAGKLAAGAKDQTWSNAVSNIGIDALKGGVGSRIGNTKMLKALHGKVAERVVKRLGSSNVAKGGANAVATLFSGAAESTFSSSLAEGIKAVRDGDSLDKLADNVASSVVKDASFAALVSGI